MQIVKYISILIFIGKGGIVSTCTYILQIYLKVDRVLFIQKKFNLFGKAECQILILIMIIIIMSK